MCGRHIKLIQQQEQRIAGKSLGVGLTPQVLLAVHVRGRLRLLGMDLRDSMDCRRSSGSGLSMGMAVTHNRLYDNAAAVQHRQDMRRIARCSFHAICRVSAACRLASSQSDAPCAAMQGKPATSAVVTLREICPLIWPCC